MRTFGSVALLKQDKAKSNKPPEEVTNIIQGIPHNQAK